MKKSKKIAVILMVILVMLTMSACTKKTVYTIEANQTAFLIPLKGDTTEQASFESEELLSEAKVATKQVYITTTREKLGPFHYEYVPDNMLIIVDRTPVTREWSETASSGTSSMNQAIYAESKESIGFSVGMNASAQIYTEDDAVKFLYSYNNKSLADIMDSEIRARVESDFVEKCANYTMNEILHSKAEIMNYVREDVTAYFAERGITITVLGMKDGIEYDDPSVQVAINASFVAERNAEAQAIENDTTIKKAEADAEATLKTSEAEAKRIIMIAEAEAEANNKLGQSITSSLIDYTYAQAWNGEYPTYYSGESNMVPVIELK